MAEARSGGGSDQRGASLALYGYPQCPFCARVLQTMAELGVDVELRNTLVEPDHAAALQAARGRGTVPVLRIEHPDGEVEWLPESEDIVEWLEAHCGRG